jgi:hypothetical protein
MSSVDKKGFKFNILDCSMIGGTYNTDENTIMCRVILATPVKDPSTGKSYIHRCDMNIKSERSFKLTIRKLVYKMYDELRETYTLEEFKDSHTLYKVMEELTNGLVNDDGVPDMNAIKAKYKK